MIILLKSLVIGMGILITAGLAVVIVTVANRTDEPRGEASAAWAVPDGAAVDGWEVGGGHLVVHLRDGGGNRLFWTFDAATGKRLAEIRLGR